MFGWCHIQCKVEKWRNRRWLLHAQPSWSGAKSMRRTSYGSQLYSCPQSPHTQKHNLRNPTHKEHPCRKLLKVHGQHQNAPNHSAADTYLTSTKQWEFGVSVRARGFCLICLNTRCKQVAANMLMLAHRAAILLQKWPNVGAEFVIICLKGLPGLCEFPWVLPPVFLAHLWHLSALLSALLWRPLALLVAFYESSLESLQLLLANLLCPSHELGEGSSRSHTCRVFRRLVPVRQSGLPLRDSGVIPCFHWLDRKCRWSQQWVNSAWRRWWTLWSKWRTGKAYDAVLGLNHPHDNRRLQSHPWCPCGILAGADSKCLCCGLPKRMRGQVQESQLKGLQRNFAYLWWLPTACQHRPRLCPAHQESTENRARTSMRQWAATAATLGTKLEREGWKIER